MERGRGATWRDGTEVGCLADPSLPGHTLTSTTQLPTTTNKVTGGWMEVTIAIEG